MRKPAVLAAVALAAALAGCGSDASSEGGSETAPDAGGGTSLTIVVTPDVDAKASTYELTCEPAGGTHPQPAQACDAIAAVGASVFEPVAADTTCTQVYAGPQTAVVTGTYDGLDVDATFSRANGCEIDRWEKLGTTFFNVPLQ